MLVDSEPINHPLSPPCPSPEPMLQLLPAAASTLASSVQRHLTLLPAQQATGTLLLPPCSATSFFSLLNVQQALLVLLQDRHPTWHPGLRAAPPLVSACSTSSMHPGLHATPSPPGTGGGFCSRHTTLYRQYYHVVAVAIVVYRLIGPYSSRRGRQQNVVSSRRMPWGP